MNMNNINEEILVKKLISSNTLYNAPNDFTESVMNLLPETMYNSAFEPLISKKGWIAIAGIISSMLMFVFFIVLTSEPNTASVNTELTLQLDRINSHIYNFITMLSDINLYLIITVSAGLLIIFEILIRELGKN